MKFWYKDIENGGVVFFFFYANRRRVVSAVMDLAVRVNK
jgi:hypothetical protein